MRFIPIFFMTLLAVGPAHAQPLQRTIQVGDVYQITRQAETANQSSDGSSGSSHDNDALMERVIAVREDGVELEYDLVSDISAEDRARQWEFPVQVFRPTDGPIELLNEAELEARVENWLKAANWTREVCGHWYFTWNAFRIECDPKSVIETIEAFDIQISDLHDGSLYEVDGSLAPVVLSLLPDRTDVAIYEGETRVDPDAVHRENAKSAVVVAEIMGEALTLDDALLAESAKDISGTIRVSLVSGRDGQVRQRTTAIEIKNNGPNDRSETRTSTVTVERRLMSDGDA